MNRTAGNSSSMPIHRCLVYALASIPVMLCSLSHAQSGSPVPQIGFVDTQAILASLPDGEELLALYKQRDDELRPLADELSALNAGASSGLSATQQDRADLLLRTLGAASARWDQQISEAAAPLEDEVNQALKTVCEDRGITVVFDVRRAQQLQLVAYADPNMDLTDEVIAALGNGS